tara:strand:+ start:380 stop:604 length:225 start_codon:yes stop_codon:yes gene_type:complete
MDGTYRNKPCWCGSGKKFKKCCIGKDRDEGTGDSHEYLVNMMKKIIWKANLEVFGHPDGFTLTHVDGVQVDEGG